VSTTRDILQGFAELLMSAGVAVYSTTTPYQPSDTAIAFGIMPSTPDRVVVLNFVPLTDDPSTPMGLVMVQVAGRGIPNNPLDTNDLMDEVFQTLHGRTNLTFGATHVLQVNRHTSVPMGHDENTRSERADGYYLDVDYEPTNLRPPGGSW
jgi:hypothetical protein